MAARGVRIMKFIICEDNEKEGKKIKNILEKYLEEHGGTEEIQLIHNRFSDVITYAKNYAHLGNVYFLDIVFDGLKMNGLKLAKQIREYDVHGYIVFITAYPELCMKAFQYKLKALDFICKYDDDVEKRIFDCLDTIKKERLQTLQNKQVEKSIVVKSGSQFHKIPLKDILYFETATQERKIVLHTVNSQIEFYDTLKNIEEKLDNGFYRCHRAFIINVAHIKEVNKSRNDMHIVMSNGDRCLLSKKYLKGLMKYVSN